MCALDELLGCGTVDARARRECLAESVLPQAMERLNEQLASGLCACYADEELPSNQRNLTDSRTRIGTLLEYLLAGSINEILEEAGAEVRMTHVVANKFPDLSFRGQDGALGARIEVKSIEAVAEEKSANFDTLIKDIRAGRDFVVVMLWEWEDSVSGSFGWPRVLDWVALDALTLARIRDCVWLGSPPSGVGDARQGFDLCFGVNAKASRYNEEEGNYGKFMRLCKPSEVAGLPRGLRESETLGRYVAFRDVVVREGFDAVLRSVVRDLVEGSEADATLTQVGDGLRWGLSVGGRKVLVVGADSMPSKGMVIGGGVEGGTDALLIMNDKFHWRLRETDWGLLSRGNKPEEAVEGLRGWVEELGVVSRGEG